MVCIWWWKVLHFDFQLEALHFLCESPPFHLGSLHFFANHCISIRMIALHYVPLHFHFSEKGTLWELNPEKEENFPKWEALAGGIPDFFSTSAPGTGTSRPIAKTWIPSPLGDFECYDWSELGFDGFSEEKRSWGSVAV